MQNSSLKAVHDDDLESLLNSLGYLEKVHNGNCTCNFCGNTITIENLGAIFPLCGKVCFSCGDALCMKQLVEGGELCNDS